MRKKSGALGEENFCLLGKWPCSGLPPRGRGPVAPHRESSLQPSPRRHFFSLSELFKTEWAASGGSELPVSGGVQAEARDCECRVRGGFMSFLDELFKPSSLLRSCVGDVDIHEWRRLPLSLKGWRRWPTAR